MSTTAERNGDSWVINGTKQWITNAPYADFVQVFARTSPVSDGKRHHGITCFIIEADEYELGRINNVVGREGMLGEIILADVEVPDSRILGEVDTAFYAAMDFLSLGRLEIGAESVGYSEFLLEAATDYATDREAFGQSIGEFQQVSSKIARGRAKIYAAKQAGIRCAKLLDADEDVIEDTSCFKWFTTNAFWEIADATVQIHGANGLAEANPFVDLLHTARIFRIVEGTDEIQLNTIAKQRGLL
jgi:acyl-CoA dehydrogenase